jgi:hypothetical protein
VRSQLARLETLGGELAGFADLPSVSAQSLAEWRAALEADAALEREIAALDASGAAEASEVAVMAVDETLLSEGIAIDAPRERSARCARKLTICRGAGKGLFLIVRLSRPFRGLNDAPDGIDAPFRECQRQRSQHEFVRAGPAQCRHCSDP